MTEAIRQGDIPGVQLRCRRDLALDRDALWRWLTEQKRLSRWMSTRARFDGETLELERAEDGKTVRERGRTLETRPGALWILAFERLDAGWKSATRLTFELTTKPGGSELSILQQGFEHLPLSSCLTIWETYRRRWRESLDRLEATTTPSA